MLVINFIFFQGDYHVYLSPARISDGNYREPKEEEEIAENKLYVENEERLYPSTTFPNDSGVICEKGK